MALHLYNTLSKTVEPVRPIDPEHVTFYTCGPTVYDDAHIGNFRSFLAADLLRRWLESPLCAVTGADGVPRAAPAGRRVTHVMNITDVGHMTDDAEGGEGGEDRMAVAGKRIAEAKKNGALPAGVDVDPGDPRAIADFYAGRFLEDARRLGLKVAREAEGDATLMPRPTAKIAQMIRLIGVLLERGHAYAAGPAGGRVVYFDVRSFPAYGRLSGNTLAGLREGAGGRVSEESQGQKRHPADFLLWKADAAHVMKWPSPWGEGYPGWHIECSAMALERIGRGGEIDLHSGGEDNIFPHHECEIAQTCGATGNPVFARLWFHPRFLLVEGEKMSKSKGNFFTPRDLFARGVEPAALRLELIRTHYRSNANFTMQGLADSRRVVERWRRFAEAAGAAPRPGGGVGEGNGGAGARERVLRGFADALDDDLNIAGALAEVNRYVAETEAPGPLDAAVMRALDAVLGVLELERPAEAETEIGVFVGGLAPDGAVVDKLRARAAARAGKDFARADAIRDELLALGYAIKDVAGGKVEVRRA